MQQSHLGNTDKHTEEEDTPDASWQFVAKEFPVDTLNSNFSISFLDVSLCMRSIWNEACWHCRMLHYNLTTIAVLIKNFLDALSEGIHF